MGKLFGTDGIRGIVGENLTADLAYRVGQAVTLVLTEEKGRTPLVTIGMDTRISSDMLEGALIAGITSMGGDVMPLGTIPTPAVAYLTIKVEADAGIVISASHNPFEHNGIKIFNGKGFKLSDELEEKIEEIVLFGSNNVPMKTHGDIGKVSYAAPKASEDYIDHLESTIDSTLGGLRILVDCANGAASATAARLFDRFSKLRTDVINADPDGVNINDQCGSTHMDALAAMVKAGHYDMGIAFDGDADRCLAVDETGVLVDGDQMIAIFATEMKRKGSLRQNTAVVTVMSNYGFMNFARESGITVKTTKVGDRYVLETMLAEGYNIGGEQSGHIIFTDYMTTGDGQLSAIQLMAAMKETGKTLSQLTKVITILPQVLVNMEATVDMKAGLAESLEISAAVRACEEELAGEGRVLIRPSGTEPLIRVMVEGPSQEQITDIAHRIVKAIQETLS